MRVVYFLSFLLICLIFTYALHILWRRRQLYYISYVLPGPFALPIIGNLYMLAFCDSSNFLKHFFKLFNRFPQRFRVWFGTRLAIVDWEFKDTEIILNSCLDRSDIFHESANSIFGNGLLTGRYDIWKHQRKYINPSFSSIQSNRCAEMFTKRFYNFAEEIRNWPEKDEWDLFPKLFKSYVETAFETLCDTDSSCSEIIQEYSKIMLSLEETSVQCSTSLCNLILLFIGQGSMSEKFNNISFTAASCLKKIFEWKLSKLDEKVFENSKNFLDNLVFLYKKHKISEKQVIDELQTMVVAGSNTVTISSSLVLIILGIYREHQEKIIIELDEIYQNSNRKASLDDLKKMNYLECVIKESFRLYSPAPILLRQTINQVKLFDGLIVPPNTLMFIPTCKIQTDPNLWQNPLKFDPERFQVKEFRTQSKLSYLPFSYGPRDCIGHKYAMFALKSMISEILRRYRILPSKYKSVDDLEFDIIGLVKPRAGCPVRLQKRIFDKRC